YLKFVDRARRAGITEPIIPGILPVTNFAKTKAFAEKCGTHIPKWIGELFEGLDDDPKTRQLVSAAISADLCGELMEHGVRDFHFFTLNRAELTRAICYTLKYRPPRLHRNIVQLDLAG
ncbi:MAG: methylenetetrahydrofolate reductase, partial [Gammaproteobacteria bacterium]|nr:methylenetetrahydrofolate reductase [Gammaproteobacteria bacterium]